MFDYTGKVVAITGASSGLGKQMAEGYAGCGANLVLLARRVEWLEASAREWEAKYGVQVLPVACDVTSTESIQNALAAIFLGAEESTYVTGQAIAVDGGFTCV